MFNISSTPEASLVLDDSQELNLRVESGSQPSDRQGLFNNTYRTIVTSCTIAKRQTLSASCDNSLSEVSQASIFHNHHESDKSRSLNLIL